MVRHLIFVLAILSLSRSCQSGKEKTIEGDLYFKTLDLDGLIGASDSTLANIEKDVGKIGRDTLNRRDRKVYDAAKFMVDNGMLRRPYVRLRSDNGDTRILLLDSSDFKSLKKYRWPDLDRSKEKVRLKLIVTEFEYPLFLMNETETAYNAVKVLSVDKIAGKTFWEK